MKEYEQKICNVIDNMKAEMRYQCDRIQEQAYKQGYKQGYATGYDHGKQDGYEDGKADTPFTDTEEAEKKAYNRGLNEAWDMAKQIIKYAADGGFSPDVLREIFGVSTIQYIFKYNSAAEALAKIKAYEDKQKGNDEVEETDSERKPPKADCDKCIQKGYCEHPESIKQVVRKNGCYGFIADY